MDRETRRQITMLCESIREMTGALNRLMETADGAETDATGGDDAPQEVPEDILPICDLGVWEGWRDCRIEAIGNRAVDIEARVRINNIPRYKVLYEVETSHEDIPEFDGASIVFIRVGDWRFWMGGYRGSDGVTIYELS